MVTVLSDSKTVFNNILAELRDKKIQTDKGKFRNNLEKAGMILGYEASKILNFEEKEVETPLGMSIENVVADEVVVATVLRAGLPLFNGILNFFDKADSALITAHRKYSKDGSFDIHFENISSPSIDGKTVIIADAMIATGSSIEVAYHALRKKGKPAKIIVAAVVASREGIEFVKKHLPMHKTSIILGTLDAELTAKSYIVPGIGDAGDLAYGSKASEPEEEEN